MAVPAAFRTATSTSLESMKNRNVVVAAQDRLWTLAASDG
jgi:hypothetical protein